MLSGVFVVVCAADGGTSVLHSLISTRRVPGKQGGAIGSVAWCRGSGSPLSNKPARGSLAPRIERISRPNFYPLKYQATIDDPGAYTHAWLEAGSCAGPG